MSIVCRMMALMFLITMTSAVARSQERPRSDGYDSIEDLFAAYKTARNRGDWKTLYALGTEATRNSEIIDIVLSPVVASDPRLKAILKEHGVDWDDVNRKLGGVLSADNQDKLNALDIKAFLKKASKIVFSNDFDQAGLYADVQKHFGKSGDYWDFTVYELQDVKRNGAVATGWTTTTHFTKVRVTGPGVPSHERTQKLSGSQQLHFRQINERWFLGE